MIISMVGFVAAGLTDVGTITCLMVLVFSIGEPHCQLELEWVGILELVDEDVRVSGLEIFPSFFVFL